MTAEPAIPTAKPRPKVAAVRVDPAGASLLREAFGKHGIETITVPFETYQQRFNAQKFDAVAVDLGPDADEFLRTVRASTLNKHAVIYGIAESPEQATSFFRHGLNALLFKPLDREAVIETVEATYRLLSGELRCYPRVALVTTVDLEYEGTRDKATSSELSGGGMSLRTKLQAPVGQRLNVAFTLPGSRTVGMTGVISWVQPGKIGIRFDRSDNRDVVRDWLYDYLEIV
jgi:DNA-binding response OmpR family regulator